jgi:hypothetical protein
MVHLRVSCNCGKKLTAKEDDLSGNLAKVSYQRTSRKSFVSEPDECDLSATLMNLISQHA